MKDLIEEVVFEMYPERQVEFKRRPFKSLEARGFKTSLGKKEMSSLSRLENTEGVETCG